MNTAEEHNDQRPALSRKSPSLATAEVPVNASKSIRVTVLRYRGALRVDVREWFRVSATSEWQPSRRGISCGAVTFAALQHALREAGIAMEAHNGGSDAAE